jgi:hypothetical protein
MQVKVYDDIQEELRVKTDALKKSKLRLKALTTEISDIQQVHTLSISMY